MSRAKGFISFEGIEGSGKTTHARHLAEYLTKRGHVVVLTEEPGGTDMGRRIRQLLLDPRHRMDAMTELLLYYASRAQHVREIIYPALLANKIVITDRFMDSTVAYQGYARGIDLSVISTLNEIVAPGLKPTLTFLLDLDVEEGLRRNRRALKEDRFELETTEFHTSVREGFLKIAETDSNRVKLIDASREAEEVTSDILQIVQKLWV